MQAIKGKTSHHLLQDRRKLWREFWGRHLWGRGYREVAWADEGKNVTPSRRARQLGYLGRAKNCRGHVSSGILRG